jgi:DNA-binding transcriptional LysR family regulator
MTKSTNGDDWGMELRQLAYFVTVCDEGTFTRAAIRLHVVQSAVSAAIKALERDVGATLFLRSSKRMDLTEAGRAFLPRAKATLDAAGAARDAVDEVRGGLRGTVRVGTMNSTQFLGLPAIIGRFHHAYPEVALQLRMAMTGSAGLAAALADGTLDLAVLSVPEPVPPGITARHLRTFPIDVVVPLGHPLAGRTAVTLADIATEPFIDFPAAYSNRAIADRAFAAAGLHRRVTVEIADGADGAEYVRAGLGVALIPRNIAPGGDVVPIPIAGATVGWPISLATPTGRPLGAAATVLARMIAEHRMA